MLLLQLSTFGAPAGANIGLVSDAAAALEVYDGVPAMIFAAVACVAAALWCVLISWLLRSLL